MKINKLLTSIFILSILCFTSCSEDDTDSEPRGDYENGILISGEGSKSTGTGSVSFVSNDFTVAENLIYKTVNNVELGTYLQSMAFDDDNAYLVVDDANTVTVVDRYTFEYKGEISTDLELPRFMVVSDNKGYVTNWGSTSDDTDDFVAVIDLSTYTIEKTISVGNGPERIVAHNGKLYVSHKGAYTTNNIVSVITIADDNVEEITVGYKPDEMFLDNDGALVVLCGGNESWTGDETEASITKIDISDNSITSTLSFEEGEHPSLMVLDDNTIYYELDGGVFNVISDASSLPETPIIELETTFTYGIAVKDNNLFITDAEKFADLAKLNVYDLTTKEIISTHSVALGASKIYFN
ncbi:YncE family protein [Neotamlana laminarinivorans]|uniref:Cell surface protein n=1 Tax=Neotamlana laminarinivorans TaxID=2883124 RepID=A0A9X1HZS1_9FLAO|nr:DUF5074 domain-containing protein [Tamlana laminarinivorans]MCB4798766.1 cell surface protein [Tamlana laminarinivorans]